MFGAMLYLASSAKQLYGRCWLSYLGNKLLLKTIGETDMETFVDLGDNRDRTGVSAGQKHSENKVQRHSSRGG
jgi:hypothetical protein